MKKVILFASLFVFAATIAFGAAFTPETLTISADPAVEYEFDGSDVDIEFNLDGAPAQVYLFITTKDMGEEIGELRNGNRGWHYVNKIDTCVYYDTGTDFSQGDGVITWDGMSNAENGGGQVAAGSYYYYLYGYDNQQPKQRAIGPSDHFYNGWSQLKYVNHEMKAVDVNGDIMANPLFYIDPWDGGGEEGTTRARWIIGTDPMELDTGTETSIFAPGSYSGHVLVTDPYDDNMVFTMQPDGDNLTNSVRRWEWLTNGNAELDTDWGDNGEFIYTCTNLTGGWDLQLQLLFYVGQDMLVATNTGHLGDGTEAELLRIDALDGFELDRMDITEWWVSIEDQENGGQSNGGPDHGNVHYQTYGDGRMIAGGHGACLVHMLNPTLGDEGEDFNVWMNANGDIIGDRNFESDAVNPWVCFDYNATPNSYTLDYDSSGFAVNANKGLGNLTFSLFGPDGTGIENDNFFGDGDGVKHWIEYMDVGSPFDGMYTDNKQMHNQGDTVTEPAQGIFWVAHDSFKGVISNEPVSVEDAAPAAFTVAQNSPNPFNPTTTINFQLANAANTTVEVFNVAGQKIDTLVDGFMDAGQHSVTWNASDFSAGVYFYTVKSGDFSQTMKMTLLK